MKKLLCIICLLATVLFVDAANASIGSPARNGRGLVSVSTVRVAATCTTCGRVSVRPVVVRPVVTRPVVSACTTCGHSFGHRSVHHGFARHSVRHAFRGHHGFGHRHSLRHRHFACTRCGR